MAEYIDREKLLEDFERIEQSNKLVPWDLNPVAFFVAVQDAPSADVVEVKHGQWKALPFVPAAGIPTAEAICSECGRDVVYQVVDDRYMFENYCPHCGAKMDKGGAE